MTSRSKLLYTRSDVDTEILDYQDVRVKMTGKSRDEDEIYSTLMLSLEIVGYICPF
jgi:hypothetical protein